MKNKYIAGTFLALFAAILNATVGIVSVYLFKAGMKPTSVAFYKCFIAFIILLGYTSLFKRKDLLNLLKTKFSSLAICAFFGLFCLYFFETAAYKTVDVAVVVFLLFGSSTIATFLLNSILEKRLLIAREFISLSLAAIGLLLIFGFEGVQSSNMGLLYAMMSGIGYGTFLTLSKRLNIGDGIVTLTLLLAFGCIYLYIPFAYFGSEPLNFVNFPTIIFLALLPTVGGFYCTLKALSLIKSQSVQLIELTEPVFALVFSFVFLGQLSTLMQLIGGATIMLSIILHEFDFKIFISNKLTKQDQLEY